MNLINSADLVSFCTIQSGIQSFSENEFHRIFNF